MSIENSPSKNEVLFAWFNHYSGVTIKTRKRTIVIDPVDIKPRTFKTVDAILVSHEHYDHLDQPLISEIQKLTDCTVVADPTSARRLRNAIPSGKLQELQPASEVKIDEVLVRAEKSNHPPAATPITFRLTTEDGLRIYHTSDSLPFPEMANTNEKERLDVVFCTVGIAAGTSPETGVEIARLVKPRVAVPYHTGSTVDQKRFADVLKKEMPKVTCLIPELGKIYQISKRG